jgi:oligopeptide/dipeptide ABC transporter ATP-binding protein
MSRTNAAGLARGRPRSPFCELTPVDGIAIYSLPRGSFLALPSAWICPASGGLRRGAFHFIEFLRMCGPPRAAISSRWVRRWPSQAVGGHLTEVGVIAAQGPDSTRKSPILICLDGVEHPYSASLLSLTSQINSHDRKRGRLLLPGEIPSPRNPPSGCRFHIRCSYASDRCREEAPVLETIGEEREVACHVWRQIRDGAR